MDSQIKLKIKYRVAETNDITGYMNVAIQLDVTYQTTSNNVVIDKSFNKTFQTVVNQNSHNGLFLFFICTVLFSILIRFDFTSIQNKANKIPTCQNSNTG